MGEFEIIHIWKRNQSDEVFIVKLINDLNLTEKEILMEG
jgi:hypothetical protein